MIGVRPCVLHEELGAEEEVSLEETSIEIELLESMGPIGELLF